MIERKITEHSNSNDTLVLEKDGDGAIIHKYMNNRSGRALKNIEKQIAFNSMFEDLSDISSVAVDHLNDNSEVLHVKMPYVEGITGYDFAITGSKSVGRKLSFYFNKYLLHALSRAKLKEIDKSIFETKLLDIAGSSKDSYWKKYFEAFNYQLKSAPKLIQMPIGSCHGDLTMSNVIYTNSGHMYLIDFLDTYLESPLQDVAKLIQDFNYGWTFRRLGDTDKVRAGIFCRAFRPEVIDFVRHSYPLQLDLISKLCLLRIIPYVSDDVTELWLKKSLKGIFNE